MIQVVNAKDGETERKDEERSKSEGEEREKEGGGRGRDEPKCEVRIVISCVEEVRGENGHEENGHEENGREENGRGENGRGENGREENGREENGREGNGHEDSGNTEPDIITNEERLEEKGEGIINTTGDLAIDEDNFEGIEERGEETGDKTRNEQRFEEKGDFEEVRHNGNTEGKITRNGGFSEGGIVGSEITIEDLKANKHEHVNTVNHIDSSGHSKEVVAHEEKEKIHSQRANVIKNEEKEASVSHKTEKDQTSKESERDTYISDTTLAAAKVIIRNSDREIPPKNNPIKEIGAGGVQVKNETRDNTTEPIKNTIDTVKGEANKDTGMCKNGTSETEGSNACRIKDRRENPAVDRKKPTTGKADPRKEERRKKDDRPRLQKVESRRRKVQGEEEARKFAVRGRKLKSSFSTLDLPSSVSQCFEDQSALSSLQSRLLSLLGRGSRYRLKRPSLHPVMSLEALRKKVKETKLLLLPQSTTNPSTTTTTTTTTTTSSSNNPPVFSSTTLFRSVTEPGSRPREGANVFASIPKYRDCGNGERGLGAEEEVELLQQYLSLQQLAISRKHSAQLRKIRDSLVSRRILSRPCSMISSPPQSPTSFAQSISHDETDEDLYLTSEANLSDYLAQSLSDIANISIHSIQLAQSPTNTTDSNENLDEKPQSPTSPTLSKKLQLRREAYSSQTPTQTDDINIMPSSPIEVTPVPFRSPPIRSQRSSTRHSTTPKGDRQELRDFLLDVGFVQYYNQLNRHGYDLATAAHMDALDLAGAGITEPLHRMALKFELDLVKQPPKVPEDIPETIEEWLRSLSLEDYTENFHQNGLYCPLAAVGLKKRDLQLMGIYMQGHRKKILLALKGLTQALYRKD